MTSERQRWEKVAAKLKQRANRIATTGEAIGGKDIIKSGRKLLKKYGLDDWSIRIVPLGTRIQGQCWYPKKIIEVATEFLERTNTEFRSWNMSEDEMIDGLVRVESLWMNYEVAA